MKIAKKVLAYAIVACVAILFLPVTVLFGHSVKLDLLQKVE